MNGKMLVKAATQIGLERVPLMLGCVDLTHGGCAALRFAVKLDDYFFQAHARRMAPNVQSKLAAIFRSELAYQNRSVATRYSDLRQIIPGALRVVPDTVEPRVPVDFGRGSSALRWWWSRAEARQPHTITYTLKPERIGSWPIEGSLTITDNRPTTRVLPVGPMTVNVTGPCITPSPPPPPTTPVPTTVPSATATATGIPTAAPTETLRPPPTPRPVPIFLPVTLREECRPDERLADIVLAIDMSTSMSRPTIDGVAKKDAAIRAATVLLDELDFTPNDRDQHDQVAVVGFNDRAWAEATLSHDRNGVLGALNRLADGQASGTRLDLAFELSHTLLDDPKRKPSNSPVILLLTDGVPNRVPPHPETGRPEDTVLAAADAAKSAGITIYTVGFGRADADDPSDRVNPELLAGCASDPSKSFVEPRADKLAQIYADIAQVLRCPTGRHDWGVPWP